MCGGCLLLRQRLSVGIVSGAVFEHGYLGARHDGDTVSSEHEHENMWVCTKAFVSLPGQGWALMLLFRAGVAFSSFFSEFCLFQSECKLLGCAKLVSLENEILSIV